MPGFTLSKVYAAPAAEVFAVFTDVDGFPGRVKGITKTEKLTPGPVGLGTKFKETRIVFKREATETFEFTAFEPFQRYELVAHSCGSVWRTEFRFTPEAAGTRVDATFDIKAVSFFARLMRPLAGMMMGSIRKCVQQDMDDLEAALGGKKAAVA